MLNLNSDKKADFFIRLIDSFSTSTEFFRWFAGDDLVFDTSFERRTLNKFERLGNYYLDDLRVFSGGGEFFLDKTLKSFSEAIDKERFQYYSLVSELSKYEKVAGASSFTWSRYTKLSNFYHLGEVCGVCWEIYEIENLLKIAASRKIATDRIHGRLE